MPKKKASKRVEVQTYEHAGARRKNIPPVGLVSTVTDQPNGQTKYQHDPHIDPHLSWAGKKEGTEFGARNVSLHIHERIDPERIIKSFLKPDRPGAKQISLFEQPDNEPSLAKAIEFYKHEQDWTNRLISGDSLLVMNSLLQKEGMGGKVQMVYVDPPYGIKYNSNFQPFVNKSTVRDGKDADIPAEPEMIQAFRDTWELGIHSYLSYLRERLTLSRELLTDSGSCFVQISDENVHLVRNIMDEVFGPKNFVAQITVKKTSAPTDYFLPVVSDFIIWYAKDRDSAKMKHRSLYLEKRPGEEGTSVYQWVELPDGSERKMTRSEFLDHSLLPKGSRVFAASDMTSSHEYSRGKENFVFQGRNFSPRGRFWSTSPEGMKKIENANRMIAVGNTLFYKRYWNDFKVYPLSSTWNDTSSSYGKRIYVVQTTTKIVQRCMLLTTDPGDLVFDPTCGSGTTAYVAEQWGRRWITCDTSRVAVTLAKQRLMTAKYDYYELAHPNEGIRSGFKYRIVPHITLKSIARDESPKEETLYDQPYTEKGKVRVTGPFTVEAVPSLRVKPIDGYEPRVEGSDRELSQTGETGSQAFYRDELKATGVRTTGGNKIEFSTVEPMLATRFIHARGTIIEGSQTKQAYISFGPEFGPLEQRQVEGAMNEVRELRDKPDFVIFAAFHFDPEAAKDIDQSDQSDVQVLKVQMSVDLLTSDLRKKRSSNQSYWLIGQPDVEVTKDTDGKYKVRVNGFDYYNPVSGKIESKHTDHIAIWFLDTDYNERSLLPAQVFFPTNDSSRDWTKLAKALNGEVNKELIEEFTGVESLPFEVGEHHKIAVKIIDNRGIESFVIKDLQ